MPSSLKERAKTFSLMVPWEAVAACILLALYARYIWAFFPNKNGLLGLDWQYVFPNLLDGYYSSLTEGYFHIPWFSPAFCGGLPKFPNPQDMYFTLPQLLMLFLAPLDAARLSILFFGAAGFAGAYLLLRSAFRCGKPAALFGAAVFLFNGFYAVGMIMGHITKHPFMLLPLCAFMLMRMDSLRSLRAAAMVSGAAACFAYTLYSGGFVLLLIMFLAILGIALLAMLHDADFSFSGFAAAFAASAAFCLLLAAAKIAAVVSFMHFFPRDLYQLPGVPNIADMPRFLFDALFGDSASLPGSGRFFSPKWTYGMHEFDFGITWIPAILVAAGGVAGLKNIRRLANIGGRAIFAAAALLLVMIVPLALNVFSPEWHAFLKLVPVIKNSSSNLRWLAVYIPLFALLAAMSLEKLFKPGAVKTAAALACIAAVVGITMYTDRGYYHDQPYNPQTITNAYRAALKSGSPPNIHGLAAFVANGVPVRAMGRNDFLAYGKSSFLCYEPVFGYVLETFPYKTLHLGPVADVADGTLNLKNPACFVFPGENGCSPGDHFKADEKEKASLFAAYRDFDFRMSTRQRLANVVSLTAWLALLAASVYWIILRATRQ